MAHGTDRSHTDRIVWIDCEMTGLSLTQDALIEVAALVTDFELNVLGTGVDVVIAPPMAALEQMGDFVRDMHRTSGLLDALADGITLADAQEQVMDYIRAWVPEAGKAPLGGNTVATDRGFIARDLPILDGWLHYRIIDVSSIKELSRRWYPRAFFNAPAKSGATVRWPTSASRSPSFATTGRPSSFLSPGRRATSCGRWHKHMLSTMRPSAIHPLRVVPSTPSEPVRWSALPGSVRRNAGSPPWWV